MVVESNLPGSPHQQKFQCYSDIQKMRRRMTKKNFVLPVAEVPLVWIESLKYELNVLEYFNIL